jgi:hypothetical protein
MKSSSCASSLLEPGPLISWMAAAIRVVAFVLLTATAVSDGSCHAIATLGSGISSMKYEGSCCDGLYSAENLCCGVVMRSARTVHEDPNAFLHTKVHVPGLHTSAAKTHYRVAQCDHQNEQEFRKEAGVHCPIHLRMNSHALFDYGFPTLSLRGGGGGERHEISVEKRGYFLSKHSILPHYKTFVAKKCTAMETDTETPKVFMRPYTLHLRGGECHGKNELECTRDFSKHSGHYTVSRVSIPASLPSEQEDQTDHSGFEQEDQTDHYGFKDELTCSKHAKLITSLQRTSASLRLRGGKSLQKKNDDDLEGVKICEKPCVLQDPEGMVTSAQLMEYARYRTWARLKEQDLDIVVSVHVHMCIVCVCFSVSFDKHMCIMFVCVYILICGSCVCLCEL